MTITIYIPDSKKDVFERIEKQAKEEDRGVGYILLKAWEKVNGVEK